jgi:endoglucanase
VAALVAALLVAVAAAGVAGLVVYPRLVGDDGPLATNRQDPAPALEATDDPRRGGIALTADAVVTGRSVEVAVDPPAGATEMQIGFDPTFHQEIWKPVADRASLVAHDVGYQTIFGRFRAGAGGETSPVSVLGVTIDPTYDAATASTAGRHRASWVRPLSPTTIVVRVETGRIERGGLIRYDFAQRPDGDDANGLFGPKVVHRNGEPYGRQVDGSPDLLRVFDQPIGRPLDAEELMSGSWALAGVSHDGDGGAEPPLVEPVELQHLTRANGTGFGPDGDPFTPLMHDVILRFDQPIEPGRPYELRPPAELVEPIEFSFDTDQTISPAVHVNQNGYAPTDRLKVGYLAGYPGELGDSGAVYGPGMRFVVVDVTDRRVVHEGETTVRPTDDGLGHGDLTGAPVYELDFSAVTEPGRYRVCVAPVGCSESFEVDADVWLDVALTVARAMYHQRSGIALGPPYTPVARPRPYHPDDGLVVVESSHGRFDSPAVPEPEGFAALTAGRTETVVPAGWGGHFDAGDWDRRIEHLYYVRAVAELVDRHPETFADLSLQIPESGDAVPDLVDEGLWTLDLYHRLQRDDGAVPGGIEASDHPLADSASWTDTLAVFTYAPDPLSSYLYAGVAAQTSAVLASYDADRAARYLESATAAMAWAEAQPVAPALADQTEAHRSVAAVAMYGATGEQRWHDLFVETTSLTDGVDGFLSCNEHTRCDAGWLYLGLEATMTDPGLRSIIEQSFIATADEVVAAAGETAFGWTLENRFVPLVWGLGVGGAPKVTALLRAFELTGDRRYIEAAERSAAVSLGANPTNMVYITGIGRNPVRHPLIVDTVHGGLPVWPGTPVYGNHQLDANGDEGWVEEFVLEPAGVEPLPTELPYLWRWADTPEVPMFNEFTVFQSHAQALYAFGLLAAHE